ncbi:hypothetical protein [Rhizobium sp. SGZ-381]|uniref:hypothetical protein n=1 Tax=Rhizobium sp. SGZ-381 TaxID=3342800 RepID=UPI00366AF4DD
MKSLHLVLLLLLLVPIAPSVSHAHGFDAPEDQSGYAIPSIDHAAMRVIAPYRDRIIPLARQAAATDAELSALLLHNQMQSANCLWLLVPGSLTDEENPFNECAHADMAGLKAMLERLSLLPQTQGAARAVISDLDHDMVLAGTSFVLCAFAKESFNTASQVRPDWGAVSAYLVDRYGSVFGLAAALAAICLTGILTLRWLRSAPIDRRG